MTTALGDMTGSEFLAAPAEWQSHWTAGIKLLTGRERGIRRTIQNAGGSSKLRKVFAPVWPTEPGDLRALKASSCQGLDLGPEFARLAGLDVSLVSSALDAAHHRKLVRNLLADLKIASDLQQKHLGTASSGGRTAGDVVNHRFTLKKFLGEGGFGEAWLVFDAHVPGEEVVIKFAHDLSVASNLAEEIRLARPLRHPNICGYYDFGIDDATGTPFVIMEFGGSSLALTIKRLTGKGEIFDLNKLLQLTSQAAAALDYMHGQMILHGDVNPGNVLVRSREGIVRARLCDFGISVLGRGASRKNGGSTVLATQAGYHPLYSAPEVMLGRHVRRASDQFSLALVICSVLEGRVFASPYVPRAFSRLSLVQNEALTRALHLDPEQRFASCSEFARLFVSGS
jgi:hypothetical protein